MPALKKLPSYNMVEKKWSSVGLELDLWENSATVSQVCYGLQKSIFPLHKPFTWLFNIKNGPVWLNKFFEDLESGRLLNIASKISAFWPSKSIVLSLF